MFAGHVGVGLAIGSAERRVNVGVFVASALAMAGSSLATLTLVGVLFVWLGRRASAKAA